MKPSKKKHIVGIDEVGRGPIAGPVAVGAVLIYAEHYKKVSKIFPVVKDSKKLTEKKREAWLEKIVEAERAGFLQTAVSFVGASEIDKKGIAPSIRKALAGALEGVVSQGRTLTQIPKDRPFETKEVRILLDGGLKAPLEFEYQETIIKGDEKELAIALASIAAKVTRDRYMVKLAKKAPEYDFEVHKGYGTRAHYAALKKHGLSKHHRKSFLKKLNINKRES